MNVWRKFVAVSTVCWVIFLLTACNESYREIPISFEHKGNHLSAALVLPKNSQGPFPVVVFVHGDGVTPYDAYGYYRPLWNRLAKQGIASFSWDKPGVGDSTGDWESQSMDDRADEVIAAIELLKKRTGIAAGKIGLIGYSQAGWVLPLVASKSDYPDFMILVSAAINWMDQGAYLTKTRLTREGFSATRIKQEIEDFRNRSKRLLAPSSTYKEYLQDNAARGDKSEDPMTPQRFQFVKLNWRYDARENLKDINSPVLAVFGDHDLNVDISESIHVYKEIFKASGNRDLTIKVFPGAQHSLLKQKYFKEMVPGIGFLVKFKVLGEDAFADGFLDFVVAWVKKKTEKPITS